MTIQLENIALISNDLPWLHNLREQGLLSYKKYGIPTAKTENWKYTKPNRFFEQKFIPVSRGNNVLGNSSVTVPFDCYCVYFENGIFNPNLSNLPQGIEIIPIIEAIMFQPNIRDKIGALVDVDKYPFAALNTAYLNEGIYLHVDSNVDISKPIVFIYHTTALNNAELYNVRNLIVIDSNSSIKVAELYCYDGVIKSSYVINVVNEMFIANDAKLYHYKVQNDAFKAGHITFNAAKVCRNGKYNSFCLQKGADMARHETKVFLSEEGAIADIKGAYLMNGWATIDITTDIEHQKPHTISSQLIKGVVGGQAKGVFQGKIHIAPNAIKTEGYQLHKAMLLSDDAEIDVKPELEIYADDVKCSHGSACGELDQDQLFYMRSRGIKEDVAKQLLIDAYLNDVIAKVDDEKIQDWIKLSLKDDLLK